MAIRVAQAAYSETGGNNGTPPNQLRTGVTSSKPQGNLDGELNIISFNGNWERVYRPNRSAIAEKIATFAYNAVANGSHIGYGWNGNTQLFDALKSIGATDPSKVKTLVNCDCATLVGAAIYYAGIKDSRLRALTTAKMDDVLLSLGEFSKLTHTELCKQGIGIKRGDILWRTGHTAVALDTDTSSPRINLNETGLKFANTKGSVTGFYTSDSKVFLRENKIELRSMSGNSYYVYSSTGTATYTLESDATYLVSYVQRNSTNITSDGLWLISTNKNSSHIVPIVAKSSTPTISINALKLTITRKNAYGRVTITKLG